MTDRAPGTIGLRPTRTAGAALAAVGALAGLVGCAAPVPPPAAPPPPVSTPGGYQAMLTETDRSIGDALAQVGRTPSLDQLAQQVLSTAGVVSAAGEQLRNSGPVPATVNQDNNTLIDGLHQFAEQLAYLSQQINGHAICTAPVALRAISTAPSTPGLRAVAGDLAAARGDRPAYHWGQSLPPAQDQTNRTLPNGAVVLDRRAGASGDGVLEVRNDGAADAVVMLSRGGSTLLSLAVSGGRTGRVDGVPDGDYDLFYTVGGDWDTGLSAFSRDCEFHRFTSPTTFTTRPAAGGSAYTIQTITLRGAADDSADTTQVLPDGLPR
ncbi:MAG TPA: hypothetical protein VGH99_03395 [Pseudonocardia sp.]|jgi:hypothetical protein